MNKSTCCGAEVWIADALGTQVCRKCNKDCSVVSDDSEKLMICPKAKYCDYRKDGRYAMGNNKVCSHSAKHLVKDSCCSMAHCNENINAPACIPYQEPKEESPEQMKEGELAKIMMNSDQHKVISELISVGSANELAKQDTNKILAWHAAERSRIVDKAVEIVEDIFSNNIKEINESPHPDDVVVSQYVNDIKDEAISELKKLGEV